MAKKIKVYQYPKCSTCVKAMKFLNERGTEVESIDITEVPPTKKELEQMLKHLNGDFKRLFNTSGVQYRELKIRDKIKTMTPAQAIDLLSGNGRLVKRPFVLTQDHGMVGFNEGEWKKVF
jgi:Spx/MgsR family transcriptional regulator